MGHVVYHIWFVSSHQVTWRIAYSPFNLSCVTENASSNRASSSLLCAGFNPVATLALGFRPAYITCLRSWYCVLLSSVSIRGCVKDHAPAFSGSSWHHTMVLALGYVSRFSLSFCQGKGLSCSMRVMATLLILLSARCLYRAA